MTLIQLRQRISCVIITILTLSMAPCLSAQDLDVTPIVRGESTTFSVTGTPPGSRVVFFFGLSGLGAGNQYRSLGLALDISAPNAILGHSYADANGLASLSLSIPLGAPLINASVQAIVIPPTFPEARAFTSSTKTLPIDSIAVFDDSFDGTDLDSQWRVHNGHLGQFDVSGGELHITPTASGLPNIWFHDREGPMIGRLISGDFTMISHVRATRNSNFNLPPSLSYKFGGIIIREPNTLSGGRNAMHAVLGAGVPGTPIAAEDKSTTLSVSNFVLHPIPSADGELRLTRSGDLISAYYRQSNTDPWQFLRAHNHPELPHTVEVGLMAYAFSGPPDIRVSFDWVQFSR